MEIEIIEEKDNPLLERKEIKFKVSYQGETPSRKMVKDKLCAMLNADEKLTILDKVESEYGKTVANGYVKVYKNPESMSVEAKYKVERNTFAEEKVEESKAEGSEAPAADKADKPVDEGSEEKAEDKAEEPKAEQKAEDKAEEPKTEEKTEEPAKEEKKEAEE